MGISDYSTILKTFFEELNSYWLTNIPDVYPSTTEESLAELYLPIDAQTTLCFFALPEKLLSFYQSNIFPIFWGHGLTPVTSADMLSSGSTIPITATLIRRSSVIVIESITPPEVYLSELKTSLSKKTDLQVIVIVQEEMALPDYLSNIGKVIKRSENLDFHTAAQLALEISSHLKVIIGNVQNRLSQEPRRLLELGEPKSALISAFSLLEKHLYDKLREDQKITGEERLSLRKLYELARRSEYDNLPPKSKVESWINTRNTLIHRAGDISAKDAKKMVLDMIEYMEKDYITSPRKKGRTIR